MKIEISIWTAMLCLFLYVSTILICTYQQTVIEQQRQLIRQLYQSQAGIIRV